MKIMAIDYGDAHTGIAVSDALGMLCGFSTVITAYRPEVVAESVKKLIAEHGVTELVLGHPINMDGTRGPRAEKAEGFAELLREVTLLPVTLWDERRTTVDAHNILMNNGKLYRRNLKKAKLDLSEFLVMCRQQGYFDLSDIQTAVFEFNGKLSILPVSRKRPANPGDLDLAPAPEYIQTEVIMDGRILDENLKRMGLDDKWLQKQLAVQGYKKAKDVFLAVCDENNQLTVFPME